MSANPVEYGFVAALDREVSGLVRGWYDGSVQICGAERRTYFRKGLSGSGLQAVLICAGTGRERAHSAAEALNEIFSPRVMVSIGFAGACTPELVPGAVVVPARLVEAVESRAESGIEAFTGRETSCAFGRGTLLSLSKVVGVAGKQEARTRFGALAVEMEAAGVAAVAAEHGKMFLAIKAISDGVEEDLEFLSGFVKPERFATGRFVAHIALRPGLWPKVAALNRNSKLAAAALQNAVEECITDWKGFSAKYADAGLTKESC